MSRSQGQIQRLGRERNILDEFFPGRVTWRNPATLDTRVEIVLTSNSDRRYTFRVYVPTDYPNSCPEMVVVSPSLRLRDGSPLPHISSTFHTIGEREGLTKICHFIPEEWTQENTLYLVFMKGRLWIEGYEGHLNTGQDIDVFLKHQAHAAQPAQASVTPSQEIRASIRPRPAARPARRSKRCVLS